MVLDTGLCSSPARTSHYLRIGIGIGIVFGIRMMLDSIGIGMVLDIGLCCSPTGISHYLRIGIGIGMVLYGIGIGMVSDGIGYYSHCPPSGISGMVKLVLFDPG